MTIPGFTAESSLYRTNHQYAMGPRSRTGRTRVVPMAAYCGNCTCRTCCMEIEAAGRWYCACCDPPEHQEMEHPKHFH
jgi:hypothetical protein